MARTKDEVRAAKSKAKGAWKPTDPWTLVKKSTINKLQTKANKTAARDLSKVAELMNVWTRNENRAYAEKQERYRNWVETARNVAADQQETIHELQTKANKTAARDLSKVAELMNVWTRNENRAYAEKQERYRNWVETARNVAADQQETIHELSNENHNLARQLDTERSNHNISRNHLNILADMVERVRGINFVTPEELALVHMYKSTPIDDSSDSETESEFEVDYEELLMAINPRA